MRIRELSEAEIVAKVERAMATGLSTRSESARVAELEAEMATQRHIRGTVQERLNKCGFRIAERDAELAALRARRCEGCRNAKWYEASPGEGLCQFVSHISFGFYCKYWAERITP